MRESRLDASFPKRNSETTFASFFKFATRSSKKWRDSSDWEYRAMLKEIYFYSKTGYSLSGRWAPHRVGSIDADERLACLPPQPRHHRPDTPPPPTPNPLTIRHCQHPKAKPTILSEKPRELLRRTLSIVTVNDQRAKEHQVENRSERSKAREEEKHLFHRSAQFAKLE